MDVNKSKLFKECPKKEWKEIIGKYFTNRTESQVVYKNETLNLQIKGKHVQDLLFEKHVDPVIIDFFSKWMLKLETFSTRETKIFSALTWKRVELNDNADIVLNKELSN